MTDVQKGQILSLRAEGDSCITIAQKLGLSVNTVKAFCRRHEKISETTLSDGLISTGNRGNSNGEQSKNTSRPLDPETVKDGSLPAPVSSVENIRLLGSRETAQILGINPTAVYALWNKGLLDYWCIHRTKKTNINAIMDFLERSKNQELSID